MFSQEIFLVGSRGTFENTALCWTYFTEVVCLHACNYVFMTIIYLLPPVNKYYLLYEILFRWEFRTVSVQNSTIWVNLRNKRRCSWTLHSCLFSPWSPKVALDDSDFSISGSVFINAFQWPAQAELPASNQHSANVWPTFWMCVALCHSNQRICWWFLITGFRYHWCSLQIFLDRQTYFWIAHFLQ